MPAVSLAAAAPPCVTGIGRRQQQQQRRVRRGVGATSSLIAARYSARVVSVHARATRDDDAAPGAAASSPLGDVGASLRRKCTGAALALATGVVMLAPPPMGSLSPSIGGDDGSLGGSGGLTLALELASPAAAAGLELPDQLDPWKEGRARKVQERIAAQRQIEQVYQKEAENRAENERLSAAYYAKAAVTRRARTAAERDNLPPAEVDAIAAAAGQRAFEDMVQAIDDEAVELQKYSERQSELRRTAEERNADVLAAVAAVAAEAAAEEAEIQDELKLADECVGADSPLVRPGSIQCT